MAICLLLTVMSIPTARAGNGRVVYLYSAELAKSNASGALSPMSGHVDIVESDLSSGKHSVLVNGFFNGALGEFEEVNIVASCGGRYIAIEQKPTVTVSEGNSPDEPIITVRQNNLWLWDRNTRLVKSILPAFNGDLLWSISGRYLAILAEDSIRIYDAYANRMMAHSEHDGFSCAAWSTRRDEFILVMRAPKRGSIVYAMSTTGQRRILFKWQHTVDAIAELGDGSGYALCDSVGVLLYRPNGKNRRLPIYRNHNDPWGVTFRPQPNSPWMAALESYAFGEPHINDEKTLYVFRFGDRTFQRMARWRTSFLSIQPSGGSVTLMEPAGWFTDKSEVVLRGHVIWGGEAAVDNRLDRWVFWTFDVPKGRTGRKIFDSGPGCLAATWWAD